jgi:hypothetical protein
MSPRLKSEDVDVGPDSFEDFFADAFKEPISRQLLESFYRRWTHRNFSQQRRYLSCLLLTDQRQKAPR